MRIELYYDVVSPYSYAAFVLLDRYRTHWNATVELKPILLGGVLKSTGNQPPLNLPARAPYLLEDLGRLSRRLGIALHQPQGFPLPTLRAMRTLTAVARTHPDVLRPASLALFDAFWGRNDDVETSPVLLAALAEAGLSPDDAARLVDAADSPEVKDALKAETAAVVARGAFGAPSYFVGDQMYFGSDRIEQLAFDYDLPYRGAHP